MAEIKGIIQQRMPHSVISSGDGSDSNSRQCPSKATSSGTTFPFYAGDWWHDPSKNDIGDITSTSQGKINPINMHIGVKNPKYKASNKLSTAPEDPKEGANHMFKKDWMTGNHLYIRNRWAAYDENSFMVNNVNFDWADKSNIGNVRNELYGPTHSVQANLPVQKCRNPGVDNGNGNGKDYTCVACSSVNPEMCHLHLNNDNNCIGYKHGDPSDDSYPGGPNTDNDAYCKKGYKEIESQHGKERADAWCMSGGSAKWAGDGLNHDITDHKNRKCLLDDVEKEWSCLRSDDDPDLDADSLITSGNHKNKTCKQLGNEFRNQRGLFYAKMDCNKIDECKSKRVHVMCNKDYGEGEGNEFRGSKGDTANQTADLNCQDQFDELKSNNYYPTIEEEKEACNTLVDPQTKESLGCKAYSSSYKTQLSINDSGTDHHKKGCGRIISGLEDKNGTEDMVKWNYKMGSINRQHNYDENSILYQRYNTLPRCQITYDGTNVNKHSDSEKSSDFYNYYTYKNDNLIQPSSTSQYVGQGGNKSADIGKYVLPNTGSNAQEAYYYGGKVECNYDITKFDTVDKIKEFRRKFPISDKCDIENGISKCDNLNDSDIDGEEGCRKFPECLGTTDGEPLKDNESNKCVLKKSNNKYSCVDNQGNASSSCVLSGLETLEKGTKYRFRDRYTDNEININTNNFDTIMKKFCNNEKDPNKFCINGDTKCSRFLETDTEGGDLNDVGLYCTRWEDSIIKYCHSGNNPGERLTKLYETRGAEVKHSDVSPSGIDRVGYCDKDENKTPGNVPKECYCVNPDEDELWKASNEVYKSGGNAKLRTCWYPRCGIDEYGTPGTWVPPLDGIRNPASINCPAICAINQTSVINTGNVDISAYDEGEINAFNNKLSATCNMNSDGTTSSTQSSGANSSASNNSVNNNNNNEQNNNEQNNNEQNEEEDDSFIKKHGMAISLSSILGIFCCCLAIIIIFMYYK